MKQYNDKLEIKLEGDTIEETWENLVSLVCSCCKAKQESADKTFPPFYSESGVGSIKVIQDKEYKR